MLAKKYKLAEPEIRQLIKIGKKINLGWARITYSKDQAFKASVIVPKSVAGTIILRNQIKRKAYDILSEQAEKKPEIKILIQVFQKPKTDDFDNLSKELQKTICSDI